MKFSFTILGRKLPAHLFAFLLGTFPAHAADFTFIDGDAYQHSDSYGERTHCNVKLEGEIAAGDFEKFKSLLSQNNALIEPDPGVLRHPHIVNLCLDSPGGSLTEALKIAEFIRRDRQSDSGDAIPFITTRLGQGAKCMSACALVFMSGTLNDAESFAYPVRSMHPSAKLGFHAPALNVPDGNYTKSQVNTAFDISVKSMATIQRIFGVGEDADGTLWRGDGPWMDPSLIVVMFETPARDMRYIETVDDAGRWGIPVYPIRQAALDYNSGWVACNNMKAWDKGRSSEIESLHAMTLESDGSYSYLFGREDVQQTFGRLTFLMDHYEGTGCEISYYNNSGDFSFDPQIPAERWEAEGREFSGKDVGHAHQLSIGSSAMWFVKPEVRLASLQNTIDPESVRPQALQEKAPQKAASQLPVDWAPRFGGDKVTLWSHNGSQMAWESKGNQRWIWYYKPHEGLTKTGVKSGTLLFDGQMAKGALTGNARQFTLNCDESLYPVSGTPAGPHVVLNGLRHRRDENCQPTTQHNNALVFDYFAASPKS